MSFFSQRNHNHHMKIHHSTYEKARGIDTRPRSTSRKIRDYISFHSPYRSTSENDDETLWQESLVTMGITNNTSGKRVAQKQKMKEQRIAALNLQHLSSVDTKNKPLPSIPKLRRTEKFPNIGKEMGDKPSVDNSQPESHRDDVSANKAMDLHMNREEEKPKQDAKRPGFGHRPAPTPPGKENRKPSHHRSKSSTSSKISEYISTGADVLDSTRREMTKDLAGKFKPPFENMNYRPFSNKRASTQSSNSSIFFCAGEEDYEAATALRPRRLSGEGTNPWIESAPAFCKLCKQPGVQDVRGLCEECEKNLMRPQTQAFGPEREIKPVPPLKDKLILDNSISKPLPEKHELRPELVIKEPMLSSVSSKPAIVSPRPVRYSARTAAVFHMVEDEDEGKYLEWQDDTMTAESEETKEAFDRWSACYEYDNEHEPVRPLAVSREEPAKHNSLDEYWDDTLASYGAKPPTLNNSRI